MRHTNLELDGETAEDMVARRGGLPVADVVSIAWELPGGPTAAGMHGMVHRDVTPASILVSKTGTSKLPDPGLVRRTAATAVRAADGSDHHPDRRVLGTPAFMAAEQWAVADRVGPPADVRAFGASLHPLLTGEVPTHQGGDPYGTRSAKAPAACSARSTYFPGHCLEVATDGLGCTLVDGGTVLAAVRIRVESLR
ncbi:MAG: protein kinase [Planctomycetes bacterium]|nr:protein kinase [Planctomycetota bacterium]